MLGFEAPVAELTEDGMGITLRCAMSDNHLAEQVPGIGWRDKLGLWYVRASWPACLVMRQLFGARLELGPQLVAWGTATRRSYQYRDAFHSSLTLPQGYEQWAQSLPSGLYGFQESGACWVALGGASLLADDMGSGKTVQTVCAMNLIGIEAFPALVICPAPVREHWRRELLKWSGESLDVKIVTGGAAGRRKIIEAGADVLIISWDSVRSHTRLAAYSGLRAKACADCGGELKPGTYEGIYTEAQCEKHERELNKIQFKTVIADEVHRAHDPNSKWTRAWWHLAWQAPIRYGLTGTPIESSVGDLWSILHGLDPVAFPGRSKFLDLFATTSRNFFGGFEVLGLKPENRDLFYEILRGYMRRLPKEVTLPFLPPKLPAVYRYPEMGGKQATAYRQMTKDMLAQLDHLLVAPNALAKLQHQISLASASGHTVLKQCRECKGLGKIGYEQPHEPGAVAVVEFLDCEKCDGSGQYVALELEEPSCKVDDLMDFLSDHNGKPLVVWAVRRQLAELAAARLVKAKVSHVMFTGAQSPEQKQRAIDLFQAGQVQLFVATLRTGSEGISLTAADTAYFMQRHSSFIVNGQAEDRIHRIGSQGHDAINTVVSLTAGTVEARIEQLYHEKGERFEEVVRDKATLEWLIGG